MEQQIVYGNPEPWLGLTFKTLAPAFGATKAGLKYYSSSLSVDTTSGAAGIALDIVLDGWDREPSDDPQVIFHYGDVRLRSLGDRTRNLVAEMANKLPLNLPAGEGCENLFVECVALNGNPTNLETQPFVGKLFFGEPGGDDECQVFLTVDHTNERAWFGEKDPNDSANVLGWLARLS